MKFVKQHMASLQGHRVLLQGEMNNCMSLTCSICDGAKDDDACLGIELYADSDSARYLVEELYRFATVTVDVFVDGACELGYDPDEPPPSRGRDVVVICTDRATSINDARVVSVDVRRPASLGRFDMYKGEPMQEADTETERQIRTFLSSMPEVYDIEGITLKFYLDPEPPNDMTPSYYVCACTEDDCTGRWPTWSGHAYTQSPGNPYFCSSVTKVGSNWVVLM